MLVGLDARARPPCLLYSFAICSPGRAMLAQKNQLLAHDNKPRASCLLNLKDASSLCNCVAGIFTGSKLTCVGGACRAELTSDSAAFRVRSIVSKIFDKTLSELRIARAYIKLLCIPEGHSGVSVSLAWIGNCEVRIFERSQANSDGMPLFCLELFDHDAKTSIDSFICHEIEDAVVVLEDLISQAGHLNEASGPDDAERHS
jgi:hypothetical protein